MTISTYLPDLFAKAIESANRRHHDTEQARIQWFVQALSVILHSTNPLAALIIDNFLGSTMPSSFDGLPCIIYGPQACGKTTNALMLAKVFAKNHIVDNYEPDLNPRRLSENTLALITGHTGPPDAISFDDAMQLARIFNGGSNDPNCSDVPVLPGAGQHPLSIDLSGHACGMAGSSR